MALVTCAEWGHKNQRSSNLLSFLRRAERASYPAAAIDDLARIRRSQRMT